MGPEYYSFDIGKVHFVVLDDVKYPCTPEEDNLDGLHGNGNQCDTPDTNPTYNGVITERQIAWLKNDLALVPKNRLVVLNMHIPIYSFIDQNLARQMVDNVVELYEAVGCRRSEDGKTFRPEDCERPVLALSGHTHTNEQIRPGETFQGWEETLDSGLLPPGRAVGASPFPQIVVGAGSGAWWSGDFDGEVIPESWQRLGAPRGYYIFEFDGNRYKDTFKATGKPIEKQMSLDMLTPEFVEWFAALRDWRNSGPEPEAAPPVNINDLPDTKIVTLDGLDETYLSANLWNGSRDSEVYAIFDDRDPIEMERTQPGEGENILETLDPFALKRQMQIARHAFVSDSGEPRANGFELFQGSTRCGTGSPTACTPRPGRLLLLDRPVEPHLAGQAAGRPGGRPAQREGGDRGSAREPLRGEPGLRDPRGPAAEVLPVGVLRGAALRRLTQTIPPGLLDRRSEGEQRAAPLLASRSAHARSQESLAVIPPSTTSSVPVMYFASSLDRKSAA